MTGQTVILATDRQRDLAHRLVSSAPEGAIVNIREANRSTDQNSLLWSLLSDISRSKPQGRRHGPEVWKALMMHACGHAVQFEMGLNGQPFPTGFSSSRLTKGQMSDLIEFIMAFGAEHNVRWSQPEMAQ